MAWQVIKQPDGKLAIFTSTANGWIAKDLTADEAEELFAEDMGADMARRLRDVRRKIALVEAGEPRKVYYQFAMTYAEAEAQAAGECEDEDDEEGEES